MYISISLKEAQDLIRKAYNLPEDVEVRIEGNSEDSVISDNKWYEVPKSWAYERCPHSTSWPEATVIEVVYRDGDTEINPMQFWIEEWIQDDIETDIVRYRKVQN